MTFIKNTALFALLIATSNAYAPTMNNMNRAPFYVKVVDEQPAVAHAPSSLQSSSTTMTEIPTKPQQDVEKKFTAAAPKAQKKPVAAAAKGGHSAKGPFAPLVLLTKEVLGDEELNKIRAKAISIHSDVIGKFVDTSETPFGQQALKALFTIADKDKSGTIEEEELAALLTGFGFDLKPKQISGIFQRADADESGSIDFDEWQRDAPKTLRTNLIKLAKKNGGELGFLA
jgi:hypothetical protein